MAEAHKMLVSPSSVSELFPIWGRFPNAALYAGGTGLLWGQGKNLFGLPRQIISLDRIEELRKITRTERYLEIGAMVKLNQILLLGKTVPEALQACIRQIASPQLRNIATIGGNICYPRKCLDTLAPLAALDAQYELRSPLSARWISASRFSTGPNALNPQELLTRIRIPLDQWDYSVFRKFIAASGAHRVIVFMVKSQKNLLTDARALINSDSVYRDKNSESLLIGKQLPLNRRDLPVFLESWGAFLADTPGIDSFTLDRMYNFIGQAIHALSE